MSKLKTGSNRSFDVLNFVFALSAGRIELDETLLESLVLLVRSESTLTKKVVLSNLSTSTIETIVRHLFKSGIDQASLSAVVRLFRIVNEGKFRLPVSFKLNKFDQDWIQQLYEGIQWWHARDLLLPNIPVEANFEEQLIEHIVAVELDNSQPILSSYPSGRLMNNVVGKKSHLTNPYQTITLEEKIRTYSKEHLSLTADDISRLGNDLTAKQDINGRVAIYSLLDDINFERLLRWICRELLVQGSYFSNAVVPLVGVLLVKTRRWQKSSWRKILIDHCSSFKQLPESYWQPFPGNGLATADLTILLEFLVRVSTEQLLNFLTVESNEKAKERIFATMDHRNADIFREDLSNRSLGVNKAWEDIWLPWHSIGVSKISFSS